MKRTGAILFWLGLVIAIAGIAVTAIFGVRATQSITDSMGEAAPMSGGGTTVTMEEGEERTILGANAQEADAARCTVLGPNEDVIPVSPTSDFLSAEDTPVTAIGTFESRIAGEYQVECTGGITSISPALDLDAVGSGVLGVLGGVLGVGLGGLLLIIGAVLWFIGRSKAKKTAHNSSYGTDGGYNQGDDNQGHYNQGDPRQGGYHPGGHGPVPPPPGSSQQPPSTNPYQAGTGSTPPPPPPPANH